MASATWQSNPWLWVVSFKRLPDEWVPLRCAGGTPEKPILFRGSMVRAILEGRKTQTRRVVKGAPAGCFPMKGRDGKPDGRFFVSRPDSDRVGSPVDCPYGRPGDRLWVRETWGVVEGEDGASRWVAYAATPGEMRPAPQDAALKRCWKPSIHMPRWACRLVLEVTDVRVERLHEISEADALAEGVVAAPFCKAGRAPGLEHVEAFEDLWRSIHG